MSWRTARHQAVLLPTWHQHNQTAFQLLADSFGAASGGVGQTCISSTPIRCDLL